MNDQFKVGTICIGQNFAKATYRNGMECAIKSPLQTLMTRDQFGWVGTMTGYYVEWADGSVLFESHKRLRRKPPKQSDSQWADEAIRKLKKQSSDHVVIGKPELIPEETA